MSRDDRSSADIVEGLSRAARLHGASAAELPLPPKLPVRFAERRKLDNGWFAAILIGLPQTGPRVPHDEIARIAESRLGGRDPLFWTRRGIFMGQFAVASASEQVREDVRRFARGLLPLVVDDLGVREPTVVVDSVVQVSGVDRRFAPRRAAWSRERTSPARRWAATLASIAA